MSSTPIVNFLSCAKTLVKQATSIPAKLGLNYGFRYRLKGRNDEAYVTIRVLHPETRNPASGQILKQSEWSQLVPVGDFINWNTGWIFEHKWEIVSGKWIIQLFSDGVKLAEKKFDVIHVKSRGA